MRAQTFSDFECIIVDNASTDGSLETLPKLDARFRIIYGQENTGFAFANNLAAKETRAPWIALLNPDAFAAPDWLEQLYQAKDLAPDIAMVGSTQFLALADTPTLDGAGDCYHVSGIAYRAGYNRLSAPPETGRVFGPCAAAALYHRKTFLDLGGFDERFFCYHEDVDMAFRMQLVGKDAIQCTDAVVHHVSSAVSSEIPDFAVYHGTRNRVWTFFKDMPLGSLVLLLPAHMAANATFILWSIFRSKRFRPTIKGMWHGFLGLPHTILYDRPKVQKTRTVSQIALLKRMTWSLAKIKRRGVHIRKIK